MTVEIYKLLINILIDCQIMTLQADMDNCFNMYVFLAGVQTAWPRATIHNLMFQKPSTARSRLGLTAAGPYAHSPSSASDL